MITRKAVGLVTGCLLLLACESRHQQNQTYSADNTGINARDRVSESVTPVNQGENVVDRTITQKVRRTLMDDSNLSTNAHNIKIITMDGVVVLRGPVNNEQEKQVILGKIRSIQGVKNIDNQLEVIESEPTMRYGR